MKWFLILISLFVINVQAQVKSPYFLYDQKKIKIDPRSFKRYVLPQLRAITQEFFLILKKLHPIHDSTINIYHQLTELERDYISFSRNCSSINTECYQQLHDIYKQSRHLDDLILKPQNKLINFSSNENLAHTDSLLQLISDLSLISNANYNLMHTIEEYLITANTNYFPYFDGRKLIEPKIHRMVVTSDLMLIQLLNKNVKAPFHAVWIHFFKRIEEKLLNEEDQVFLIRRLEELNLAWNTFHMKMTKENSDLPPHVLKLIKIMHNRWNSCLKIILR